MFDTLTAEDKKWLLTGMGCSAGGLLISLFSKNSYWATSGTLLGLGVVGYKIYDNSQEDDDEDERRSIVSSQRPTSSRPSLSSGSRILNSATDRNGDLKMFEGMPDIGYSSPLYSLTNAKMPLDNDSWDI